MMCVEIRFKDEAILCLFNVFMYKVPTSLTKDTNRYLGQYQLVFTRNVVWASASLKCLVIVASPKHTGTRLMLLHKQCLHHTGPLGLGQGHHEDLVRGG